MADIGHDHRTYDGNCSDCIRAHARAAERYAITRWIRGQADQHEEATRGPMIRLVEAITREEHVR